MNLRQFRAILVQSLVLPVIALLLVAAVLSMQIRSAEKTVILIQLADQSIADATEVEKLIVDEESGLRGYQTTSDPQFLAPYREADQPLSDAFNRLRTIAASDPAATARVDELYVAHQTWKEGFAVPLIITIQAGGVTRDVTLNLQGKQQMDRIRSILKAIVQASEATRTDRVAQWQKKLRRTLEALLGSALALGLILGLFTRSRLQKVSRSFQGTLDELRRQAHEIFESEQRLRITLSSIGDGVIVCSVDGKIEMMNRIAQELTGWSDVEAAGQPIGQVFNIANETTRQLVENPVAKVKRLNRVVGLANHTILVRKDGSEINIDDSGAPILDLTGTMVGIVLVFRDITMERRTQAALLANEKLAVAGRLAATIAHEIHNPLDSVSNLLYLMRTGATPEEFTQFLTMAEQELARATQISRAMLGLYRESKSPVPVDLKEMFDSILLLMERRFEKLKVEVSCSVPENLFVQGFPAELRQVFTNLITNAAEAATDGGKISITVNPQAGAATTQPGVMITVADNGPGIPDNVQEHLFRPFFTTKGEQGTGLGLWVSHGIVQKHEGSITLTSSTKPADHGTRISVFLPGKLTGLPTEAH